VNIPHLTEEQLAAVQPALETLADADREIRRTNSEAGPAIGRAFAGLSAAVAAFAAAAAPGLAALEAEAALAEEQTTRAALEEIEAELDLPQPAPPAVELVCPTNLAVLLDLCAGTDIGKLPAVKVEATRAIAAIRSGRAEAAEVAETRLAEVIADWAEEVGVRDCQPRLLPGWISGGRIDQALFLLEGAMEESTTDPGLGYPDRSAPVRFAREAVLAALVLEALLDPVPVKGIGLDARAARSSRMRQGFWSAWGFTRRDLREQQKWHRSSRPEPVPQEVPPAVQREEEPTTAPAPAPTAAEVLVGLESLLTLTWLGEVGEIQRVTYDVWAVPPAQFKVEEAAAEVARAVEDELERCLVEGRPWDLPGFAAVGAVTSAAWNLRHLLRGGVTELDPGLGVEPEARPGAVRLARAELRRAVVAAVLAGGCERWKGRPSAGLEPFEVPRWYREPREWGLFGDDLP
jgi:hypothetical protein